MWPSRRASPLSGEQQTEPFAAWASSDESLGLQLRALVPDIVDQSTTRAGANAPAASWRSTFAELPTAMQRLRGFDLVGALDCATRLWGQIGRRMGWEGSFEARLEAQVQWGLTHRPRNMGLRPPRERLEMQRLADATATANLSVAEVSDVARAAAVDMPLYEEALARC